MMTTLFDALGATLIVLAVFLGLGLAFGVGSAGVAVLLMSWSLARSRR